MTGPADSSSTSRSNATPPRDAPTPGPMPGDLTLSHVPTPGSSRDRRPPSDTREPSEIDETLPTQIGRYQVRALIGSGGFGRVLRAFDPELSREVAVKMPHRSRIASPADAEAYLTEARHLAALDHPGIVPVYDCGRTIDGSCYVVSKLVPGGSLSDLRKGDFRPPPEESARLVADLAEALDHAHRKGLVHRDVKPANILLDGAGRGLITDFGLALSSTEESDSSSGRSGTPAYMSPEQARGESHLVDARSDVYSLGVVLYELLTGELPYRARKLGELLDEIAGRDVRPPRQANANVPRELDRICTKALSRKPAERYSTALDLASDLRQALAAPASASTPISTEPASRGPRAQASLKVPGCLITVSVSAACLGLVWFLGTPLDKQFALAPTRVDPGRFTEFAKSTVKDAKWIPQSKAGLDPKKTAFPSGYDDWTREDYLRAAEQGSPRLAAALRLLAADPGDLPDAEKLFIELADRANPAFTGRPLDSDSLEIVISFLAKSASREARQALYDLGKPTLDILAALHVAGDVEVAQARAAAKTLWTVERVREISQGDQEVLVDRDMARVLSVLPMSSARRLVGGFIAERAKNTSDEFDPRVLADGGDLTLWRDPGLWPVLKARGPARQSPAEGQKPSAWFRASRVCLEGLAGRLSTAAKENPAGAEAAAQGVPLHADAKPAAEFYARRDLGDASMTLHYLRWEGAGQIEELARQYARSVGGAQHELRDGGGARRGVWLDGFQASDDALETRDVLVVRRQPIAGPADEPLQVEIVVIRIARP